MDLVKLKADVKRAVRKTNDWSDVEVKVEASKGRVTVKVSQMYEFLPITFSLLMELAEVFGTKDFNVNNWSSQGCETCDYGSEYVHEFTFSLEKR